MDFQENLRLALAKLSATGISRPKYAPLPYRGLWRLGIRIPPPHFSGFIFNALFSATSVSVTVVLMKLILEWSWEGRGLVTAIEDVWPIGGGVGIVMAIYYWLSARWHKLPLWENLAQD